jgi:hypothetical protein
LRRAQHRRIIARHETRPGRRVWIADRHVLRHVHSTDSAGDDGGGLVRSRTCLACRRRLGRKGRSRLHRLRPGRDLGAPGRPEGQDGDPLLLSEGRNPGCTKEACSFRDTWDAIAKTGAVLIGVSADTLDSHKAFAAHYKLPFLLVSDPDGIIGKSYGVPFQGHHQRETFVIGADGNVRKAYRQVDVSVHSQQILGDLAHPS